jgi:hypothetical protein
MLGKDEGDRKDEGERMKDEKVERRCVLSDSNPFNDHCRTI